LKLTWEHIVWLAVALISIIWYVIVFVILRKNKAKKNSQLDSNVQNSNIFVNNSSFEDLDMDALLNQVDENVSSTELLNIFEKSPEDAESLIPNRNEKLKVIKNDDPPPELEDGKPPN